MRVYLPTTLAALPGILSVGELAPCRGYAVTPALREAYASGDEEELEYVAMLTAARESLRLLAADKAAPRRRVVLAADVVDAEVTAIPYDDEPAAVTIGSAIGLPKVASGHVDDEEAEEDVAAAAEASPAADAGSDDAQFTVEAADAHELAWYATQELQDLL